jgi:hypothetical protein
VKVRPLPARVAAALLLAATQLVGAPARGAPDGQEPLDDPKLARRLGTRISWEPRSARIPEPPGSAATISRSAAPSTDTAGSPSSPPRLKLGFRRFEFVRLGASDSPTGTAAPEPFNSLSIDVYPLSTFVRVGLSTQYGWQSGSFATNGDYFAAQSVSLGGQLLGRRVVPFAEGFAGVGYMRRLQFDRTVPTVYWHFGIDAGAEVYFSKIGFVSVALGYLRPVNGFAKVQEFTTIFADTWSFKLGVGI